MTKQQLLSKIRTWARFHKVPVSPELSGLTGDELTLLWIKLLIAAEEVDVYAYDKKSVRDTLTGTNGEAQRVKALPVTTIQERQRKAPG